MVLREVTEQSGVDLVLLDRFNSEIKSRVPHLSEGLGSAIINGTPLLDITDDLIECGRIEYGLDVSGKGSKVFGKLESSILGGSVKVRPAVRIIEDAIISGRLRGQTTVFEATSGNFGIALGLMGRLGLDVVALVSRKLQEGVLRELRNVGVRTINLGIDICPAPGFSADQGALVGKAMASGVRNQLVQMGFDATIFDSSLATIEELLSRGDAISLAKLLAKIYHGFCPEQYDNELNVMAHEILTGPEIDEQLRALGSSLSEFEIVCTFGTGGTSAGLSRYISEKFGVKSVHLVFPLINQDVAGIRSKEKALGLKFYEPRRYAAQHEVDFDAAKRVLRFFVDKGYDIGESSALALCAVLHMINEGIGKRFVVILADGILKYKKSMEIGQEVRDGYEVTALEASSNKADFGGVLWTHPIFQPSEDGMKLIASSLGFDEDEVRVAGAGDVETFYMNEEMNESFGKLLPNDGRRLLLVCMNGSTSLGLARLLAERGVKAKSLTGGIEGLSASRGGGGSELIELAKR